MTIPFQWPNISPQLVPYTEDETNQQFLQQLLQARGKRDEEELRRLQLERARLELEGIKTARQNEAAMGAFITDLFGTMQTTPMAPPPTPGQKGPQLEEPLAPPPKMETRRVRVPLAEGIKKLPPSARVEGLRVGAPVERAIQEQAQLPMMQLAREASLEGLPPALAEALRLNYVLEDAGETPEVRN